MKKHIFIGILVLVMSGCALLNQVIPQDKKEEAINRLVAEACKEKEGMTIFLRGSDADGVLEVICE